MNEDSLKTEVFELIELGAEGDYWDFKLQWYDNNAELVHDIISFANNLVNRDAFIIIGVTDSKSPDGTQIIGVQANNRKSQQNVIDLLRSVKFAGGVRPTVYIYTILHKSTVEIDVIVVKNTSNTPYFLSEPYNAGNKCVRAGYIYTRIGDTNTPINSFADMDKIEHLWRKRFGIDLSINERILMLLDDPGEWEGSFGSEDEMYHKTYPEFRIKVTEDGDSGRDYERNSITKNIADWFPDKGVKVYDVEIMYHSTRIYDDDILLLDGARHMIPFPNSDTVYLDRHHNLERSLTYQYFNYSTIKGKLFRNLVFAENRWYGSEWYLCPGCVFLEFQDESDKVLFDEFVRVHLETLLGDYQEALNAKGYIKSRDTNEYFIPGWSKGNEIKARHLYERFRGFSFKNIIDYVYDPPKNPDTAE